MTPMVPDVLRDAGALVVPRLRQAVETLSVENQQVVDYHMGWRDAAGEPVQRRGSKSVRPGLALLSAAAAGGSAQDGLPGAVAVECLHNFAFLHDDVMDGDRFRRQRETAWVVFGQSRALNAGTAMLVLGSQTLLDADSPHREAASRLFARTCATMMTGQGLDVAFEDRLLEVTVEESMAMTRGKTAALLSCATSIGAVLCVGETDVTRTLHEFGTQVGIAFQARDDLLGIWGRPEQTGGRPPGFDLVASKGTLPAVVALQAGGAASDELRELLSAPLEQEQVARAAALVERAGGRAWTEDLARRCVAEAEKLVAGLTVEGHVRDGMVAVARMGLPDDV